MKNKYVQFILCCFLLLLLNSCRTIITNVNAYEEQGPGPLHFGGTEGLLNDPVAGAVSCILPDMNNPNKLIIGTVNGGIWKTENALDPSPYWFCLDDSLPSMSISCITKAYYDDENENVLFAGIANRSSYDRLGGPLAGILKSTDGGSTWIKMTTNLDNKNVLQIAWGNYNPAMDFQSSLFVATNKGLYISYNQSNFIQSSLTRDTVSDVWCNSKGTLLLVAVPNDSVYFSTDFGRSFVGIKNIDVASTNNIKLSITDSILFIATSNLSSTHCTITAVSINSFQNPNVIARPETIDDDDTNFLTPPVAIGPFSSPNQSFNHFSFITRKGQEGKVELFVGGVSNKNLIFGSTAQEKYSGRLFKGVLENGVATWEPIVGNGSSFTAPHADSRFLAFDADGNLLEADDGGIYKLTKPSLGAYDRQWFSLNGNLKVSEITSVGYDSKNHAIIAGLQDNGIAEQIVSAFSEAEKIWTSAPLVSVAGFELVRATGDGYSVNVDNAHNPPIRYTMLNGLNSLAKREYSELQPPLVGSPFNFINFWHCNLLTCMFIDTDRVNQEKAYLRHFELNSNNLKKFSIGDGALYTYDDYGSTITVADTLGSLRKVSSLAYGAGTNEDIIYYARRSDTIISQQKEEFGVWTRRTLNSSAFTILDICIDPDNIDDIYCVTKNNIMHITNFNSITSFKIDTLNYNLQSIIDLFPSLSSINLIKARIEGVEKRLLIVSSLGELYLLTELLGQPYWIPLAKKLPNVLVTDVEYNAEDDILIVGTLGRGVWVLKNFSLSIPVIGVF